MFMSDFVRSGRLRDSTNFVTIELQNFDDQIDHNSIILYLSKFLTDYGSERPACHLTDDAILRLVILLLQHQYVQHENTVYRKIQGLSLPKHLQALLTDIILHYWEKELLRATRLNGGVFGRSVIPIEDTITMKFVYLAVSNLI